MRVFIIIGCWLAGSLWLCAETNMAPNRLAVVAMKEELRPLAEMLTVQLGDNRHMELLERDQLSRLFKEQGQSADNRGDVKSGRISGAEALLILDLRISDNETNIDVTLTSVRPGVLLWNQQLAWPIKDMGDWGGKIANRTLALLPRLQHTETNAVRISILNFRSIMNTGTTRSEEMLIKQLAMSRLSQQPGILVLDRERMLEMALEKELNAWGTEYLKSSYLLDGTLDRDGYNANTMTLDATLSPPGGGMPIRFRLSGSRTNVAIVNLLVQEVARTLNIVPAPDQNPLTNEAAYYLQEAAWAVRWGKWKDAQSAADAVWILGRRDFDAARMRVWSCFGSMRNMQSEYPFYGGKGPLYSRDIFDPSDSCPVVHKEVGKPSYITDECVTSHGMTVTGYMAPASERLAAIAAAQKAVSAYLDGCQALNSWFDEPANQMQLNLWTDQGTNLLYGCGCILQNFYFPSGPPKEEEEPMAQLREGLRQIDGLLQKHPIVRRRFYTLPDSPFGYFNLCRNVLATPNLFAARVEYGPFWQDSPDECVELYRDLMKSPLYACYHERVWLHNLGLPHIIPWNRNGQRTASAWNGFIQELKASTNVVLALEGKAMETWDSHTVGEMEQNYAGFMDSLIAAIPELVNVCDGTLDNVWGVKVFLDRTGAAIPQSIHERFRTNDAPKFERAASACIQQKNQAGLDSRLRGFPDRLGANRLRPALARPPGNETNSIKVGTTNSLVIKRFLPIPIPRRIDYPELAAYGPRRHVLNWNLGGYSASNVWLFSQDEFTPGVEGYPPVYTRVVAVLDNSNLNWRVTEIPTKDRRQAGLAVCGDTIFMSSPGAIKHAHVAGAEWETHAAPWDGYPQLLTAAGRLFASDGVCLYEILDHGAEIQLVASTRRKPEVCILDTQDIRSLSGFYASPTGLITAAIGMHAFGLEDDTWKIAFDLPSSERIEVFEQAVTFRALSRDVPSIWILDGTNTKPCVAFSEQARPVRSPWDFHVKFDPRWKTPGDERLTIYPMLLCRSNLYLLAGSSKVPVSAYRGTRTDLELSENRVFCFTPGLESPVVVPVSFDNASWKKQMQTRLQSEHYEVSHLSSEVRMAASLGFVVIVDNKLPWVGVLPLERLENEVSARVGERGKPDLKRTESLQ